MNGLCALTGGGNEYGVLKDGLILRQSRRYLGTLAGRAPAGRKRNQRPRRFIVVGRAGRIPEIPCCAHFVLLRAGPNGFSDHFQQSVELELTHVPAPWSHGHCFKKLLFTRCSDW